MHDTLTKHFITITGPLTNRSEFVVKDLLILFYNFK